MDSNNDNPQAEDHLKAYLDCGSITLFVTCTIVLTAIYAPSSLISPEEMAISIGLPEYLIVSVFASALLISGTQITNMWAERAAPSVLEMSLFWAVHLAAFLVTYLAVAVLQPIIQSSAVPFFGITLAIASAYVGFSRSIDANSNEDR